MTAGDWFGERHSVSPIRPQTTLGRKLTTAAVGVVSWTTQHTDWHGEVARCVREGGRRPANANSSCPRADTRRTFPADCHDPYRRRYDSACVGARNVTHTVPGRDGRIGTDRRYEREYVSRSWNSRRRSSEAQGDLLGETTGVCAVWRRSQWRRAGSVKRMQDAIAHKECRLVTSLPL